MIASATSSGRPARPCGIVLATAAWLSGLPITRANIAVSMYPGPTALTRTPNGAASSAAVREADDSVLAGHIQRQIRKTLVAEDRCDVDDRTAALVLHDTQLMFHRRQCSQHVGAERFRVLRCAQPDDGRRAPFRASVVDRDVKPAEGFHRGSDQLGDLTLEPHVGMDKQ